MNNIILGLIVTIFLAGGWGLFVEHYNLTGNFGLNMVLSVGGGCLIGILISKLFLKP